jgi:hypothetical protein
MVVCGCGCVLTFEPKKFGTLSDARVLDLQTGKPAATLVRAPGGNRPSREHRGAVPIWVSAVGPLLPNACRDGTVKLFREHRWIVEWRTSDDTRNEQLAGTRTPTQRLADQVLERRVGSHVGYRFLDRGPRDGRLPPEADERIARLRASDRLVEPRCGCRSHVGRNLAAQRRRRIRAPHLVAIHAEGGTHDPSNLHLLCSLCRARHKKHYADYPVMPRSGGALDDDAVVLRGIIRARSGRPSRCRRADSGLGRRAVARCERARAPSSRGLRRDTSASSRSIRDQATAR